MSPSIAATTSASTATLMPVSTTYINNLDNYILNDSNNMNSEYRTDFTSLQADNPFLFLSTSPNSSSSTENYLLNDSFSFDKFNSTFSNNSLYDFFQNGDTFTSCHTANANGNSNVHTNVITNGSLNSNHQSNGDYLNINNSVSTNNFNSTNDDDDEDDDDEILLSNIDAQMSYMNEHEFALNSDFNSENDSETDHLLNTDLAMNDYQHSTDALIAIREMAIKEKRQQQRKHKNSTSSVSSMSTIKKVAIELQNTVYSNTNTFNYSIQAKPVTNHNNVSSTNSVVNTNNSYNNQMSHNMNSAFELGDLRVENDFDENEFGDILGFEDWEQVLDEDCILRLTTDFSCNTNTTNNLNTTTINNSNNNNVVSNIANASNTITSTTPLPSTTTSSLNMSNNTNIIQKPIAVNVSSNIGSSSLTTINKATIKIPPTTAILNSSNSSSSSSLIPASTVPKVQQFSSSTKSQPLVVLLSSNSSTNSSSSSSSSAIHSSNTQQTLTTTPIKTSTTGSNQIKKLDSSLNVINFKQASQSNFSKSVNISASSTCSIKRLNSVVINDTRLYKPAQINENMAVNNSSGQANQQLLKNKVNKSLIITTPTVTRTTPSAATITTALTTPTLTTTTINSANTMQISPNHHGSKSSSSNSLIDPSEVIDCVNPDQIFPCRLHRYIKTENFDDEDEEEIDVVSINGCNTITNSNTFSASGSNTSTMNNHLSHHNYYNPPKKSINSQSNKSHQQQSQQQKQVVFVRNNLKTEAVDSQTNNENLKGSSVNGEHLTMNNSSLLAKCLKSSTAQSNKTLASISNAQLNKAYQIGGHLKKSNNNIVKTTKLNNNINDVNENKTTLLTSDKFQSTLIKSSSSPMFPKEEQQKTLNRQKPTPTTATITTSINTSNNKTSTNGANNISSIRIYSSPQLNRSISLTQPAITTSVCANSTSNLINTSSNPKYVTKVSNSNYKGQTNLNSSTTATTTTTSTTIGKSTTAKIITTPILTLNRLNNTDNLVNTKKLPKAQELIRDDDLKLRQADVLNMKQQPMIIDSYDDFDDDDFDDDEDEMDDCSSTSSPSSSTSSMTSNTSSGCSTPTKSPSSASSSSKKQNEDMKPSNKQQNEFDLNVLSDKLTKKANKKNAGTKRANRLNSLGYSSDNPAEKRAFHILSERQRRNDLKKLFETLRTNIPALCDKQKASKLTILKAAVDHLVEVANKKDKLNSVYEKEKLKQIQLMQHLKNLQQQQQQHQPSGFNSFQSIVNSSTGSNTMTSALTVH
jgi:hypothetical protein